MFQFRRFPTYAYFIQRRLTEYCSAGFPHSEIPGSKLMCSSPRLIAACHVLHRLSMPRHSPCALISLTSSKQSPFRSEHPAGYSSLHSLASPLPREPACAGLRSDRFWFSSRIMQASDSVHCSFVLPFKKSTKVYFVTSLLLARNFLLAFTVQFSRYRRRRSKVHSVRNILSDIPHFISLLLLFLANPLALGFARSWMTFFWSKTRLKCSDACPNTSIYSWWRLPDSNR